MNEDDVTNETRLAEKLVKFHQSIVRAFRG
jgi:hypothetical protein